MSRRECCPDCGTPAKQAYCDVCGYDLVEQIRTETAQKVPPRL